MFLPITTICRRRPDAFCRIFDAFCMAQGGAPSIPLGKENEAMLKHFRVPGRLAVKLEELGVSVPAVLRRACLPRDLFEQTRVLVSTSELFALWRAIDHVCSDPLIGIKL